MATERIDIVVSERGARVVRRNIEDIGRGATSAEGAVSLLRRTLGTIAVGAGIKQLVDLLDTFTNLQNRIRGVTQSTAQLTVVTQDLFDIANRTRQSFESTAELYARTALAVKDLGISQQQTLQFTESLNQAVVLSGASAAEAQAGIIQLAQGLASGTLRGDELRSVLEQLPAVADVIAKSLGVTRGELRKLGEDGKINAGIVLKAFQDAREELAEKFAKTVPTIGQSFTVLRNRLIEFIGGLDSATGASTILANAILSLGQNIETLARIFAAAAIVIGTVFARQAIGAAITAIGTLTAAIAANPIGAIAIAVLSVLATLTAFSDKILLGTDQLTTLADVGVAAFDELRSALGTLADFFSDVFSGIGDLARRVFGDFDVSLVGVLRGAATVVDRLLGLFAGSFNAIVAAFRGLPAALGDIFLRALNGAITIVEAGTNRIIGALNTVLDFVGSGIEPVALARLANSFEGGAANLGSAVREGFIEGFNVSVASDTLNRVIDNAEKRAQDRLAKQKKDAEELAKARAELAVAGPARQVADPEFEKIIKRLQQENELLKLNNRERQIQAEIFQAENTLKRQLTATEERRLRTLLLENQALEDARVIRDYVKDLDDEFKILQTSNREREIRIGLLQLERQLGRELTESEAASVRAALERNRLLREENDLLDQIRGPQQSYEQNIETLNRLLASGKISQEEYNRAQRDFQIALLETQTTVEAGYLRGFLKAQAAVEDFSQASERLITDAFREAQDVVVEFFETGKLKADEFFRSLAANFIKLGTQQAFAALSGPSGFGGLFGGGQQAGGGGLSSLLGGGGLGGGIGGLFSGLFGFANGGSFEVGASTAVGNLTGVDNRLVAFRARDGETVHVDPPGGGRGPVNVTFNVQTPDAESFRRSQGQIMAQAAAAFNRANQRNN